MTTAQMRYFITVAECLSVTEAADRLYLSQPALSRHIAQMEAELNVPLFLRTRNTIRLTPAGQVLLEGLRQIYGDYRGLLERVEAVNAGVRGSCGWAFWRSSFCPRRCAGRCGTSRRSTPT